MDAVENTDAMRIGAAAVPAYAVLKSLAAADFDAALDAVVERARGATDPAIRRGIMDAVKTHPVWQLRQRLLDVVRDWLPDPEAMRFITHCTHDNVDFVAFKAIRICGDVAAREAIPHLVRISGWPSKFRQSEHLRKPVGIGAALTKSALVDIFGETDPDRLWDLEKEFLAPYLAAMRKHKRAPSTDGMVRIPAGPFTFGTNEKQDEIVYFNDYLPERRIELDAFWIDEFPVTNADYAAFLEDAEGRFDTIAHPDAPPGKDYTPAHWRNPRFNRPDAPVVGVDWYDAWAYASWAGKQLPTETQWEKAARGPGAHRYPWGDEWDPALAVHLATSFGVEVASVEEWEKVLVTFTDGNPERPVKPNGHFPGNKSGYGVRDMIGNTWEWTRTNYYSRKPMSPFFKHREPVEFMNRPDAFAVIRGGCFTSIPQMLRAYYRGKDLLTDRHCEIGFRCVIEGA